MIFIVVVFLNRYKVELNVIDGTGSTTFVVFDRVVSNFLGMPAQDLIGPDDDTVNSTLTPSEFRSFYERNLLLKVEISDSNITQEWNNYNVRRLTADPDIIKQFKELHSIQVCYTLFNQHFNFCFFNLLLNSIYVHSNV